MIKVPAVARKKAIVLRRYFIFLVCSVNHLGDTFPNKAQDIIFCQNRQVSRPTLLYSILALGLLLDE